MTNVTVNKLQLLLDTILTLEILLLLKMSKLVVVDMSTEPLKEEIMVKNQLLLDKNVKVPQSIHVLTVKQFK